jgi:hypothetical protein
MMDKIRTQAANEDTAVNPKLKGQPLAGLFDEMQALMALMPGTGLSANARLSTEEETEAMFDNMPV